MEKKTGSKLFAVASVFLSGALAYLTATRVMPSKDHGGKGIDPTGNSTVFEKYSSKFSRKNHND